MSEYAIVRTHGLKTRLLSKEDILNLSQAKNISNFIDLLKGTEYSDLLYAGMPINEIIRAIHDVFWSRMHRILRISPDDFSRFLRGYLAKIDINAILYFIREKILKVKKPTHRPPFYGIPSIILQQIERLASAEDILLYLRQNLCFEKVDKKKFRRILNTKKFSLIELLIWNIYYTNLMAHIQRLPEDTATFIRRIIGIELDVLNIMTVLSEHSPEKYGELIREKLILPHYRIHRSILMRVSQTKDQRVILELLSPYKEIVKILLERGQILAYVATDRQILGILQRKCVEIAHDLAYLFYYVKLAEFECKNLAFCAYAIYHNFSPEEIQQYLVI